MPKKKKSSSFAWKATKLLFKGIGYTLWYAGKGAYWLAKKGYSSAKERIKEGKERKRLESIPTYGKKAEFDALKVLELVNGEYAPSEKRIHSDSIIALIFGKRGSGKSALGFRLLENIYHKTKRKCLVLGVGQSFMPEWIKPIEIIDEAPNGSVVLVDEGALSFNARESMSKKNKGLGPLLAVARHKNLTILFITQNTGMIDKNVLQLSDVLLVKQGSLLQLEMERPEIKKFYEKAEASFKNLIGDRRQFVYLIDSDFEGALSHSLPSFWTESLSKSHADEDAEE
jgi:hypothetical protein